MFEHQLHELYFNVAEKCIYLALHCAKEQHITVVKAL